MNSFIIKLIAVSIGIVFSAGAMAQAISHEQYKDSKTRLGVEFKTARAACNSLAGNAKDLCVAEAQGQARIARAELMASYQPSARHHYKVRVAHAEADYGVARQHCDDQSGNVKDVCIKEARAARIDAMADARTQLMTVDANAAATETSVEANTDASIISSEARQEGHSEKIEAQYSVAREKCKAFSGAARDDCMNQAKSASGR